MLRHLIRGITQNHAKLALSDDDPRLHPITIERTDAVTLANKIRDWANHQPHWEIASRDIAEPTAEAISAVELHLTRRTSVFRFVDDIQIAIKDNETGCIVNAESQSRLGKGDLGQNRRNLIELRNAVEA